MIIETKQQNLLIKEDLTRINLLKYVAKCRTTRSVDENATLYELIKFIEDYSDPDLGFEWYAIEDNCEHTLEELKLLQDIGELTYSIEYDDGSDMTDKFVNIEIINPHYEQDYIICWVPEAMAAQLKAEKATEPTGQYHNWTSELTFRTQSIYETEQEALLEAQNIEKEMKKEYPAIISLNFECEEVYHYNELRYQLIAKPEISSAY